MILRMLAVRASPIGAVGSFAQQQAEATKALITGQQKEPESVSEYLDEAMSLSYKVSRALAQAHVHHADRAASTRTSCISRGTS